MKRVLWYNLWVLSGSVTSDSLWPNGLQSTRLLYPWDFPGKNTGVGSHFLLQGIFPTQGSNLLWQVDSSPLNHRGSPQSEATLLQFHPWTWRKPTLFYWLSGSVWCQMGQCLYRFPLFLILRVDQDAREIWHLDLERKVLGVLVGDTNHLY